MRSFWRKNTSAYFGMRMRWRIALAGVIFGCLVYIFTPWRGTIWNFDPDRLARLEANMWHHYYEKHFVLLAFDLYAGVRENYHVSPFDAALMAWDLAKAAKVFQSSGNRQAAEQAIPILERCYRRLSRATDATINPHRAATLELEWWQQRRELVPPNKYALTIAQLAREIYSRGEDPLIDAAALERAEAMAFRDAHRKSRMNDADWGIVTEKLTRSYRLLHEALIGKEQNDVAIAPSVGKQDG